MKRILFIFISIIAIANVAVAADKPNFSGDWKMNAAKSNFDPFPAPASFTRKITHDESKLSVTENQTGGTSDGITTRTMTTDGEISVVDIGGAPVNCSATWQEEALIATTEVEMVGLKYIDTMTLSEDGRELTSKVIFESPMGDGEITVVFERQ